MALVYLDDVMVFGPNLDEHLKRLELLLRRLEENGLNIKGLKCNFDSRARTPGVENRSRDQSHESSAN